jgi:hypothetical protein
VKADNPTGNLSDTGVGLSMMQCCRLATINDISEPERKFLRIWPDRGRGTTNNKRIQVKKEASTRVLNKTLLTTTRKLQLQDHKRSLPTYIRQRSLFISMKLLRDFTFQEIQFHYKFTAVKTPPGRCLNHFTFFMHISLHLMFNDIKNMTSLVEKNFISSIL